MARAAQARRLTIVGSELGSIAGLIRNAAGPSDSAAVILYAGPGAEFQGPGHALGQPGSMTSSDRVLVTGASGFVGSAVAKALTEAGFDVRALVRATSPRKHLEGLQIEFAEGDLRDAESVRRAMTGVRHVFHVAADYRLWARDPREISAVNVEGTRILMTEALRAGVEKVVYTSSVATLALNREGKPVDETLPLTEANAIGVYKRSKVAAERMVEAMIASDKLPAIIVNPSTPIGPRDVKPTPTGRIIVETATGRMPGFVDTGLNLVHVDDVAAGHLAALHKGKVGERYILGGRNFTLQRLFSDLQRISGVPAPSVRLNPELAAGGAILAERLGLPLSIAVDETRSAAQWWTYSSAKAKRELGFTSRPHEETLEDAVADVSEALGGRVGREPTRAESAMEAAGRLANLAARLSPL